MFLGMIIKIVAYAILVVGAIIVGAWLIGLLRNLAKRL